MSQEHYFTSTPDGDPHYRSLEVMIASEPRTITVANGVFSHAGVDKGTVQLLRAVPMPPEHGTLLDIGCGWGPIALTMALQSPQAEVIAIDPNERAQALTERNAAALGCTNVRVMGPHDVDPALRFDLIWSNPPIRVGKQVLHDILSTWLPRLNINGEAWLVVQKQLGADSLQRWLSVMLGEAFSVERAATAKGFRILRIRRLTD